jgi:hypothetical protein
MSVKVTLVSLPAIGKARRTLGHLEFLRLPVTSWDDVIQAPSRMLYFDEVQEVATFLGLARPIESGIVAGMEWRRE